MLDSLPPDINYEDISIYKRLVTANKALAELKGYSSTIPNKHILINAMTLNEAKDSSEIEQIVTTHDELYKAMSVKKVTSNEAKEVLNYRAALWEGYQFVQENRFIHTNLLIQLQQLIEPNKTGIRKIPGTAIRNLHTGEIIYTPPQNEIEIREFLSNLEQYVNTFDDTDPLIKLAFIHYQFEAIHPFYDGNGRTGRILNVLYLVLADLIDSPILYLSKYILRTKSEYYQLLQRIQEDPVSFKDWILYILKGVEETAAETLTIVQNIVSSMNCFSDELKRKLPSIHSRELVDALFFEFSTKAKFIEKRLGVSTKTARSYLNKLETGGFLSSEMIGKEKIYKNDRLFELIQDSGK